MNFESVEKIASAILYEGYILYPYRPTALKNRERWNFGTLYPAMYAEAQRTAEPCRFIAEMLVLAPPAATLDLKISSLQLVPQQPRQAETGLLADPSLYWDEGIERTSEHHGLPLSDLLASPYIITLQMESADLPESRSSRQAPPIQALLTLSAKLVREGAIKLHLEVQNTTPLVSGAAARREEALPHSLVSAHMLLGIVGGEFVSQLDPPETLRELSASCCNLGVFPVLAGSEPDHSVMLCSPIILYDYPKIAPESEGDFFDGTEMDEMLTLRVLTLTDAEKDEMRRGDVQGRRILERIESLTAESMLKAHGVIRAMREIRQELP